MTEYPTTNRGLLSGDGSEHLRAVVRMARKRALVVVLSEIRGLAATKVALQKFAGASFRADYAYCGAETKENTGFFLHKWEMPEPSDWVSFLKGALSPKSFDFFFGSSVGSRVGSPSRYRQLWISGLIQAVFRSTAIEKIMSLQLDKEYEWIFFVRADYLFERPFPSQARVGSFRVLAMDGDSYGGINDRFIGFESALCERIRKAFDLSVFDSPGGEEGLVDFLGRQDFDNPEKAILFLLSRENLLGQTGLIAQNGFCVRHSTESSRWSLGYWSSKRQIFVKYPTELALAKLSRVVGPLRLSVRPLLKRGRIVPSSVLANLVRTAGTQPRLMLAPLLLVLAEGELSRRVFLESPREAKRLPFQILRDLRTLFADGLGWSVGKRTFGAQGR